MIKRKNVLKINQALTITELLIVISILGILLTLVVTLFSGGVRAFKKSVNKMHVNQQAQLALDRLSKEVNESYGEGISTVTSKWNGNNDPNAQWDGICLPTCRTNNEAIGGNISYMDDGKLKWERYIIYFKNINSKELFRKVINVSPPYPVVFSNPNPIGASILELFFISNSTADLITQPRPANIEASDMATWQITSTRTIARDVYNMSFELYNPDMNLYNLTLVTVTVDTRVYNNKDTTNPENYIARAIIKTNIKPINK